MTSKREQKLIHYRSKVGVITRMYYSQKAASIRRGHSLPLYNKSQFREWVLGQEVFQKLYNNWVESGYDKYLVPTCDRIDSMSPYMFDNMQIVTWKENINNHSKELITGSDIRGCKGVLKIDKDGMVVGEYHSISAAARENKINKSNIGQCCGGGLKTAGGYFWEYKD